jgi:rhodanese-related sulfurtransferase
MSSGRTIGTVDYEFVKRALTDGSAVVIDVRNADEIRNDGALPGAVNIPLANIPAALACREWSPQYGCERPAENATVVFLCRSGVRARTAATQAADVFANVRVYEGSFLDWCAHNSKS